MIEVAIIERLASTPAVTALVPATRMYSGSRDGGLPQRPTMPAIVVSKIDKLSPLTLDGGAAGPNTLRAQVDCWDDDHDGVRALAAAVNGNDSQSSRGALHGFSGPSGGERVLLLELAIERATELEPDTKLFRVSADYRVHL
jgi:hypothetical protein